MKPKLFLAAVLATIAVLMLSACNYIVNKNENDQAQGITTPSDPSPSPGAACALASIQPGTSGDVREIAQGATLGIGVSLFGPQGLPLVDSCLSQYAPVWRTVAGPCSWAGSHNGVAHAPDAAPLDDTCLGAVDVGALHGELRLVVVAP